MTSVDTANALAYYARHHCALFPIPHGSKDPIGIISSFKHDWSRDPVQWQSWSAAHPNCNFGIVAFASNLIIVDIDTHSAGREAAWKAWHELCLEWGLPGPLAPHCQSARGGWHVYCAVPEGIDAATLRQPDAIKKLINVRCIGYTVAAGSYYDGTAKNEQSGHYMLMSDAPPHPAPAALVEHCSRRAATPSGAKVGTFDFADVSTLYQWMVQHDAFAAYEDWLQAGMIAKVEYGDAGLPLWEMTHDGTVTPDVEQSKWESFASEATADSQTLGSLMQRARRLGWIGQVRKSTATMFSGVTDTVAAIASAAGATLSSQQPIPLADTQRLVAALGQPVLDNFLAGTKDAPLRPGVDDIALPDSLKEHPLFEQINECISRILAMAESKGFRQSRVLPAIAVLYAVHPTVCENLTQRIAALGGVVSSGSLDSAIKNFEWRVRVDTNTSAGFILDSKGNPASENSDNVHVFIRQRAVRLRWNTWKDTAEVSDADRDAYLPLTDHLFGDLLMDAENSQFNYHPSEGRFKRGLLSNARRTMFDPLLERIDQCAAKWDGTARLDTWLSHACGTPNDAYHVAVGRNLIGGMVRRARHPGCQHAETVIFISPDQGTGKSTLTKILALNDDWHTDSLKLGGRQQDMIPQMSAKWVIELGELAGMSKSDVEDIKQFMSATSDNYTKKYEAFATEQPRRCVFIGTSNDRRPLQDISGNRRFLPVHVQGEIDLAWTRQHVEMLIGEAAVREANGETFSIPREVWGTAAAHQEAARSMTPVEELCYEWFDRPPGSYYVTASDIGRALKMAGQKGRYAAFMDKMGWQSDNLETPDTGRKSRVWLRHTNRRLVECIRLEPMQRDVNGRVEFRMTPTVSVSSGSGLPPLPPSALPRL